VAAIASIRAAAGDEFFAPEATAPVAARASGHSYPYAIDKHGASPGFSELLRLGGDDVDALPMLRDVPELNYTFRKRKQRVVSADAHVVTGAELGAALTDQDIARAHDFAAKFLHAKALRIAVATIARAAACFFVCHVCCLLYA
jgi:hypothetical protein